MKKKQYPILIILSMKDFNHYIASIISFNIREIINKHLLDLTKCQY